MHDYMNEAIKKDQIVQLPEYAETAATAVNTQTGEILASLMVKIQVKAQRDETLRMNRINRDHPQNHSSLRDQRSKMISGRLRNN